MEWEVHKEVKKLVVRVKHAPGKPVMVDFEQSVAKNVTAEHFFYHKAGRYTAMFSGVPEDLVFVDLVLVDLTTFKEKAERVVFPRDDEPLPERITPSKHLLGPR